MTDGIWWWVQTLLLVIVCPVSVLFQHTDKINVTH